MTRQPSKIDELSNAWVVKLAELSPSFATYAGFAGGEDKLDDNSPAAIKHYYELEKEMLAKLEALEPVDAIDEVSKDALAASLKLGISCGGEICTQSMPFGPRWLVHSSLIEFHEYMNI